MQICAKRAEAAQGIMFPSDSGSKPHKAYAWKEGAAELNGCFCSCKAFIFGRSRIAKAEGTSPQEVTFVCKHLQSVFDNYCGWHQTNENEYRYDRTCPKCGGDVIDTDDNLVPDNPDDAVDDLRAMLAEMNGEEAPAPIARQPEEWTVIFKMEVTYSGKVTAHTREEAEQMWGDLYGMSGVTEVEAINTYVAAHSDKDEPAKPEPAKRVRKAKAPPAAKPSPAKAKAAAADLAKQVAPRRRSA